MTDPTDPTQLADHQRRVMALLATTNPVSLSDIRRVSSAVQRDNVYFNLSELEASKLIAVRTSPGPRPKGRPPILVYDASKPMPRKRPIDVQTAENFYAHIHKQAVRNFIKWQFDRIAGTNYAQRIAWNIIKTRFSHLGTAQLTTVLDNLITSGDILHLEYPKDDGRIVHKYTASPTLEAERDRDLTTLSTAKGSV